MFHTYCYLFKVTALFSFALLKWFSQTVKNIYQPPSQSPNASKHSLCLWGGSAASDLCEERFDCDRKRGLSTAGTWMTAKREGGGFREKTPDGSWHIDGNHRLFMQHALLLVKLFIGYSWMFYFTFTVSGSRSPLQLSKYFFKSCRW